MKPGLNEQLQRKIWVSKVMLCFGNNIASFLAKEKSYIDLGSGVLSFESHWVNEFFNTIVYFKSNTAEEIATNCVL